MWEQQSESLKFKMFGNRSVDHHHTTSTSSSSKGALGSSSSSSSGLSSGSKSSSSSGGAGIGKDKRGLGTTFVSRLGFKFDVANYDINAISPTSW